jgi:uncharacterized alkaline shock family protein YloU
MVKSTLKNELGRVHVSDLAIAEIAALAATRVSGVAGMGSGSRVESLAEALGLRSPSQGVQVEMGPRELSLKLFLILEFGVDMAEVALQVQDNVAEAVEKMSSLELKTVDVVIQGVRPASGEKKGR